MDTGERLAAYLSGDLDTDEHTALEAELAGDPALRAQLERIRAADTALADLPDVELPDGFPSRLRERVAPEVAAVVGDELAARRAGRRTPTWLPALGAAAALAVVVAGGITVVGGTGGSDDAADTAQDGARTTADAGGADDAMMMDESAEAESMPAPEGPTVVNEGRTLGPDDLAQLASDPDVLAAIGSEGVQTDPQKASDSYATAMRGGTSPASDGETQRESEAAGATTESAAVAPADLVQRGDVSPEDLDAVARCLPTLFEDAMAAVIPLYAELATEEDGEDVIVYAALSPDSEGEYRRVEIWMVDRDTCDLRRYHQNDA